MVTTSPDNLVTPDSGSAYALTADLALLADRVQTMGNNIRGTMPAVTVANLAARNARFPTPQQGDRVFRADLGYEEGYFTTFNESSNPGGTSPGGWWPLQGADISGFAYKTDGYQTIASGASSSITLASPRLRGGMTMPAGDRIGIPFAGVYEVSGKYYLSGSATLVNCGMNFSGGGVDQNFPGQVVQKTSGTDTSVIITQTLQIGSAGGLALAVAPLAGGSIQVWGNSTPNLYGSYLSVRYVGPPR